MWGDFTVFNTAVITCMKMLESTNKRLIAEIIQNENVINIGNHYFYLKIELLILHYVKILFHYFYF